MSRDAFGPNLRRVRLQRGISIEHICTATKIPGELLVGLESNDFSAWPAGIYARSYVRQYANAIGVDPDTTVDEFCRWFPQGDRRAAARLREHASIVGHELEWRDDVPFRDRRVLHAPAPRLRPRVSGRHDQRRARRDRRSTRFLREDNGHGSFSGLRAAVNRDRGTMAVCCWQISSPPPMPSSPSPGV
jgi:transcriptional regulator with XRE-family HTH domain